MYKDQLEIYTLSIIFVGEFNPTIIQPFWLSSKNLIRENEAAAAKIDVIHNAVVRFEINEWAFFEITKNRFQLRTSKESEFEPLKDLAFSIFEILKETPIRALGINHILHFALRNSEQYFEFGNKLAPLSNWNDVLNEPGVLILEVKERTRKDDPNGYLRVRITPSDQIPTSRFGITVNINDHYSSSKTTVDSRGEVNNILKDKWSDSFKRTSAICDSIWTKLGL